jgi:DNA-binding MarR family transcriptional regulator
MMNNELVQKMMFLLNKIKLIHTRAKDDLGIPQAEFVALTAIQIRSKEDENGEGMSASTSDVANYMGATMPAMSKTIRNLSMKGYVKQVQSQTDRRVTKLALTDKGKKIVDEVFNKKHMALKRALDEFGPEKTKQLIDLLDEFTTIMEEGVEDKDV